MAKDKTRALFLIDPQHDFCDPEGALPVPDADQDMIRLADKMNSPFGDSIDQVIVTLDQHHTFDIAHPMFWVDENGDNPAPFTIITVDDVETGRWKPADIKFKWLALSYVRDLEESGRSPLCIWTKHCVIGTKGACVVPAIAAMLDSWERRHMKAVNYVYKGMNPLTEHYSAIKAEVPDPLDDSTFVNKPLVKELSEFDIIYVGGEAATHCVPSSIMDLVALVNEIAKRIVLLEDAMSDVPGFGKQGDKFFADMLALGAATAQTTVDDEELLYPFGRD